MQSANVTIAYQTNGSTYIVLLMLAACSAALKLPTMADTYAERECSCVTGGDCPIADMADGQGEERKFQCRWEDQAAALAVCTYESRFHYDDPGTADLSWSSVTVRLRHLDGKGWCWIERS